MLKNNEFKKVDLNDLKIHKMKNNYFLNIYPLTAVLKTNVCIQVGVGICCIYICLDVASSLHVWLGWQIQKCACTVRCKSRATCFWNHDVLPRRTHSRMYLVIIPAVSQNICLYISIHGLKHICFDFNYDENVNLVWSIWCMVSFVVFSLDFSFYVLTFTKRIFP